MSGTPAIITMLPAGPHVRQVHAEHILPNAPKAALLIAKHLLGTPSSDRS